MISLRRRLTAALLLALSVGPEFVHSQECTSHAKVCTATTKSNLLGKTTDCHCCAGRGRLNVKYTNQEYIYGRFCALCPAGQFSGTDFTKSSAYIPVESVANDLAFNPSLVVSDLCTLCAAGYEATTTGRTSCTLCAAGAYSTSTGTSACTRCAAGKYGIAEGATAETT